MGSSTLDRPTVPGRHEQKEAWDYTQRGVRLGAADFRRVQGWARGLQERPGASPVGGGLTELAALPANGLRRFFSAPAAG